MSLVLNVPMNAEMRLEFTQYVYKRWCEAFDAKKAAKEMVFDRKIHGDHISYEGFKEDAIAASAKEFTKWNDLLEAFKAYSPLVRQMKGLEP